MAYTKSAYLSKMKSRMTPAQQTTFDRMMSRKRSSGIRASGGGRARRLVMAKGGPRQMTVAGKQAYAIRKGIKYTPRAISSTQQKVTPYTSNGYTTPTYTPKKTQFTPSEIMNWRRYHSGKSTKWAKSMKGATNWQITHSMTLASAYPDYPPVETKNGNVVNTKYWVKVGEGSYVPKDQYERNQLFLNDREKWNELYWAPYN